jgi:hypothetical protein
LAAAICSPKFFNNAKAKGARRSDCHQNAPLSASVRLDGRSCFTRRRAEFMLCTAMGTTTKKSLKAVLTEFRRGIAHHRAQGASDERIRQLLGEAIHFAFQEVKDPELRAWLCEELDNAARVGPSLASHPASRKLH